MGKKSFSKFKSSRQISHPHLTDIKQKWWQLGSIQSAGVISLPVILLGSFISSTYGFYNALISIFIGNLILMSIGLIVIFLSFSQRQSILELARDYVGYFGGMLIGATLVVLVIFGWIPLQLNLAESELLEVSLIRKYICEENCVVKMPIVFSLIVSFVVCFGIKGIKWFAVFSMPFILGFLSIAFFYTDFSLISQNQPLSLSAVPLVLGFGLSGITDFPTFFRHSKNINHGTGGVITTLGLLLLGEVLGVFLTGNGGTPLQGLMKQLQVNIHPFLIGFIIILTTINANTGNVYIASVGWEIWVPKVVGRQEYFILGLGGIVSYSLINSIVFFKSVVEFCDIIVCGFAGVLTACYFFKKSRRTLPNEKEIYYHLVFWIIGILLGSFVEVINNKFIIPPMIVSFSGSFIGLTLFFYFGKIIGFSYFRRQ